MIHIQWDSVLLFKNDEGDLHQKQGINSNMSQNKMQVIEPYSGEIVYAQRGIQNMLMIFQQYLVPYLNFTELF